MTVMLNQFLLRQMDVSSEQETNIIRLHEERERIFDIMADLDPTDKDCRSLLRIHSGFVAGIEFQLQSNWNFEENADLHSWWYKAPHCICRQAQSYAGKYGRKFDPACPIHGRLDE